MALQALLEPEVKLSYSSLKPSVLVAGGAGFLGSHLCKKLLEENFQVTCVDSLVTSKRNNITDLEKNPSFSFIETDIRDPQELKEVDLIFNLAAAASPPDYLALPIETLETGSIGTQNLLELAKKSGARFIHASTSEVYGDPLVHPQVEEDWGNVNPIGPRSVYDESKRFSEALCFAYKRSFDLDIGVMRIFNTYGPNMRPNDGRVVSNFIVQALSGEPLTIYGNGSQTRSLCYVDDMIEGIFLLGMKNYYSGPVNLGNPNEISVREFAKIILELTGSNSKILEKPLPQDDPTRRCPDILKAKKELGWEPIVSLKIGLNKTINYFNNELFRK